MTVLGSLAVDGLGKIKLLNDDTGLHVEVVTDNLDQLLGGLLRCAVGVDVDRQRLGNTDSVRQLDESAAGQTSGDQRLGNPATEVSGRAVDLGEVLSGECTTTVGTPATVRVNNDLTAGKTSVTLGSTNDEKTGGLNLESVRVLAKESYE